MVEQVVSRQHGWLASLLGGGVFALRLQPVSCGEKLATVSRVECFGGDALPGGRAEEHTVFRDVAPANRPCGDFLSVLVLGPCSAVPQLLQVLREVGLGDTLTVTLLHQVGDGTEKHGLLRRGGGWQGGDLLQGGDGEVLNRLGFKVDPLLHSFETSLLGGGGVPSKLRGFLDQRANGDRQTALGCWFETVPLGSGVVGVDVFLLFAGGAPCVKGFVGCFRLLAVPPLVLQGGCHVQPCEIVGVRVDVAQGFLRHVQCDAGERSAQILQPVVLSLTVPPFSQRHLLAVCFGNGDLGFELGDVPDGQCASGELADYQRVLSVRIIIAEDARQDHRLLGLQGLPCHLLQVQS